MLLFSDQHNAGTLGCEGHPDVRTPHLDALAASGTRFERAYCQDAICLPSRCSMFSGLYPRTLGCLTNGDRTPVMDEVVSMQETFRQNGYTTAAFGKRHLMAGCDAGWDTAASHMHSESPHDNYVKWIEERGLAAEFAHDWAAELGRGPKGGSYAQVEIPFAVMGTRKSQLPEDATMEAFSGQRTAEYLKERAADGQPFFCFSSFYRPHQPYTPLPSYWARFECNRWGTGRNNDDAIAMPPSLRQDPAELPPMLQGLFEGRNRVWRTDLAREDEQLYRDYVSAYYALVEEVDDHTGVIMNVLEETGLRENTIVVYATDHGDFVGRHGMIEKCAPGHNVYEETLRVPLIVSWPAHLQTRVVCDGLAELVDIYPTLLGLCELCKPELVQPLQGQSLADTLRDGTPIDREFTVSENWSQATIVTRDHKLGIWCEPPEGKGPDCRAFGDMLFDRTQDPDEIDNRSDDPVLADIKADLRSKLEAWRATE
ncbi:MAG: sulfatase-like hydrolase/transferase [Lentisphaerae bacterium]|nr:sulfatase-like hydrolase/transferase [Lentisphaerota bacterium]MBT7055979.1 sulfatase-like hydrolase/transferase [Lentisphaerota bacterium]MBT7848132.1 sulfatase-like hydrolase/transferase [Lentisphaerota bacterium]